jgi:hypothetical protein
MTEKFFNVVDPKDNSNVFGGAVPLEALRTIYPMASVTVPQSLAEADQPPPTIDTLHIDESIWMVTVIPSRGHGVYRVTRVR